jgi:hypothetical protein
MGRRKSKKARTEPVTLASTDVSSLTGPPPQDFSVITSFANIGLLVKGATSIVQPRVNHHSVNLRDISVAKPSGFSLEQIFSGSHRAIDSKCVEITGSRVVLALFKVCQDESNSTPLFDVVSEAKQDGKSIVRIMRALFRKDSPVQNRRKEKCSAVPSDQLQEL